MFSVSCVRSAIKEALEVHRREIRVEGSSANSSQPKVSYMLGFQSPSHLLRSAMTEIQRRQLSFRKIHHRVKLRSRKNLEKIFASRVSHTSERVYRERDEALKGGFRSVH